MSLKKAKDPAVVTPRIREVTRMLSSRVFFVHGFFPVVLHKTSSCLSAFAFPVAAVSLSGRFSGGHHLFELLVGYADFPQPLVAAFLPAPALFLPALPLDFSDK